MTDEQLQRLLGKRIQQLRLERGLKQEEMCQFGFEYKYYQLIEYGEKNLSLKILNRLSKAFKIEIAELFNFRDSE
ncbi:MAG: helix-turn-helix transcriptional regulator [Acidobacteriota bacterium]